MTSLEKLGGTRLSTPNPEEISRIPQGEVLYWRAGSYFVGIGHDSVDRAVWLTDSMDPGGRRILCSGNTELARQDVETGRAPNWTKMDPNLAAQHAHELIQRGVFLTLMTRKK